MFKKINKKKVNVSHICIINPESNNNLISNHSEIKKCFGNSSSSSRTLPFSSPSSKSLPFLTSHLQPLPSFQTELNLMNEIDENDEQQMGKKKGKNNEKKRGRVASEEKEEKENGIEDENCNESNREIKRKRTISIKLKDEKLFYGYYLSSCDEVERSRRMGGKKKRGEEDEEEEPENLGSKRAKKVKFENLMDSTDEMKKENKKIKKSKIMGMKEGFDKKRDENRIECGQNFDFDFDSLIVPENISKINLDGNILENNFEAINWIINGGEEVEEVEVGINLNVSFNPDFISDEDLMSFPVFH